MMPEVLEAPGGAPPKSFWPSGTCFLDPKAQFAPLGEKLPWHFSPILFPAKITRKETLLKTASDSAVFIQV